MKQEFDISLRQSDTLMMLFLCFWFGSTMPILYIFGLVGMTIRLFVDKWALINATSLPPSISGAMNRAATGMLPFLGIIHCVWSLWALTCPETFPYKDSNKFEADKFGQ